MKKVSLILVKEEEGEVKICLPIRTTNKENIPVLITETLEVGDIPIQSAIKCATNYQRYQRHPLDEFKIAYKEGDLLVYYSIISENTILPDCGHIYKNVYMTIDEAIEKILPRYKNVIISLKQKLGLITS